MERFENHYLSLGINTLFKHNPTLKDHLRERYDGDLVGWVHRSSHISMGLALACECCPYLDVRRCSGTVCGPHHLHSTGDPGWCGLHAVPEQHLTSKYGQHSHARARPIEMCDERCTQPTRSPSYLSLRWSLSFGLCLKRVLMPSDG